jgi:hypothetical protein
MKKVNIVLLILALAVGVGFAGPVQATDITIYDFQYHQDFGQIVSQAPGSPGSSNFRTTPYYVNSGSPTVNYSPAKPFPTAPNYKMTPSYEDNSVTSGAQWGHKWDMEAAALTTTTTNNLMLIGGWNWKTGLSGYTTGDLLIDTGTRTTSPGFDSRFGRFITQTTYFPTETNAHYRYEHALRLIWSTSTTGTWYLSPLIADTDSLKMITQSVAPDEGWKYSKPYALNQNDSWFVANNIASGNISMTNVDGNGVVIEGITLYGDGTGTGYNNTHYKMELTGFMDALGDLGFTDFRGHITMNCGNDTLVMQSGGPPGAVPLPGALLLMGAGLTRLAAYYRRNRQNN